MAPVEELAVISVSIDLGAGRRGVDMGPSALRIAGLTATIESLGHRVMEVGTVTAAGPEAVTEGDSRAKFLDEITRVCRQAGEMTLLGLEKGCFPLILGGDHSLSAGTTAGVAAHYRQRGESIGLLWIDAHTDMNTPETTPSGNVHGMPLATLTGLGPEALTHLMGPAPAIRPEHVVVIAARELDSREKETVREAGVRVITMSEVDERGIGACMDEALERLTDGTAGFHVSLDLDSVDPIRAPGVGTPVAGGLTYREAHLICEKAARSGKLLGLEVVELNPVQDFQNQTARLAVGLVASALGKTIL
ncbi:MAG: arginase [Longimicrobiales bacterium]